jgi:hypothetical protein
VRSFRQEFPKSVKEQAYERSGGKCEHCYQAFDGRVPHYDHYPIAAALGGPGTLSNCRVLCIKCHRHITANVDAPRIAESKRIEEKRKGIRGRKWNWPKRSVKGVF